jgi:hypothetical protein
MQTLSKALAAMSSRGIIQSIQQNDKCPCCCEIGGPQNQAEQLTSARMCPISKTLIDVLRQTACDQEEEIKK